MVWPDERLERMRHHDLDPARAGGVDERELLGEIDVPRRDDGVVLLREREDLERGVDHLLASVDDRDARAREAELPAVDDGREGGHPDDARTGPERHLDRGRVEPADLEVAADAAEDAQVAHRLLHEDRDWPGRVGVALQHHARHAERGRLGDRLRGVHAARAVRVRPVVAVHVDGTDHELVRVRSHRAG